MPEVVALAGEGNSKLGRKVGTFSMAPVETCPGATEWCKTLCYAKDPHRRYVATNARWNENQDAARLGLMPEIPKKTKVFRIHVSGDFFSAAYIRRWIRLVKAHPDVLFWGYTRSWRVKRLLPALEELRAEPNVQLFASTDFSIDPEREPLPEGWRVAYVETTAGANGLQCPEQVGKKPDCESCGYCFRGQRGNVIFKIH